MAKLGGTTVSAPLALRARSYARCFRELGKYLFNVEKIALAFFRQQQRTIAAAGTVLRPKILSRLNLVY